MTNHATTQFQPNPIKNIIVYLFYHLVLLDFPIGYEFYKKNFQKSIYWFDINTLQMILRKFDIDMPCYDAWQNLQWYFTIASDFAVLFRCPSSFISELHSVVVGDPDLASSICLTPNRLNLGGGDLRGRLSIRSLRFFLFSVFPKVKSNSFWHLYWCIQMGLYGAKKKQSEVLTSKWGIDV